MKRPILSMLLSVLLLLPGCTQAPSGSSQEEGLTVLATTYPVYLFARTVAQGVEGVTVERLNTGSVSCLHDYTLTVGDMKKLEGADVVALNGAGMEEFMEDALAAFAWEGQYPAKAFQEGLLSPRVALEVLTPWRRLLEGRFSPQEREELRRLLDEMEV